MKSNVQQPQRIVALSLSGLKVDKFACLFFILGIMISAWFLHRFIFKHKKIGINTDFFMF